MKQKIIDYGATYQVVIESADAKCIICIAPSINEGFILLHHGLINIPNKGDKGKIIFERDKEKGHWQYYPNLVIAIKITNKQIRL